MSVVIALIGIINTMSLSILERRRELGLLRIIGMTDTRVRRMVTLESVLIAFLGTLSGLLSGLVVALALVRWPWCSRSTASARPPSPRASPTWNCSASWYSGLSSESSLPSCLRGGQPGSRCWTRSPPTKPPTSAPAHRNADRPEAQTDPRSRVERWRPHARRSTTWRAIAAQIVERVHVESSPLSRCTTMWSGGRFHGRRRGAGEGRSRWPRWALQVRPLWVRRSRCPREG